MSTDLDAIRLRAATWFRAGTQHPVERDVLDLLDEVERLRQDYEDAHADRLARTLERDRTIDEREYFKAEVERLRGGSDVVDTAVAYVNAPDGSDEVEQCWWELKNAVANYQRASTGGDSTDG